MTGELLYTMHAVCPLTMTHKHLLGIELAQELLVAGEVEFEVDH